VPYFGEMNAIQANTDESFWKRAKPAGHHVPDTGIEADAKWLQDNVDWFRNRVVIQPESYEHDGFRMRGLKSKARETVRAFV
jgi:hypothetical protein